jgi:hypothetical protein
MLSPSKHGEQGLCVRVFDRLRLTASFHNAKKGAPVSHPRHTGYQNIMVIIN